MWATLIHHYWVTHAPHPEPNLYRDDLRGAVQALLDGTGCTLNHLSEIMGSANPSTFKSTLSRGGVLTVDMYLRLEKMALEHQMPVLADWFGQESRRHRKKTRLKTSSI